ncbi:DUF3290 domain-containing protein [Paenibacillus nuruki]|nr:DUF3290 domain-containing protein [Paenibacillus nuruki]
MIVISKQRPSKDVAFFISKIALTLLQASESTRQKKRGCLSMDFYTIAYLENQSTFNVYLKYIFIFVALILLLILFSLYMRKRIETKYRDLSIILLLVIVFLIGVQYSDYTQDQSTYSKYSQMVQFVHQLAKDQQLDETQISVNSTTLVDEVIIKTPTQYYTAHFNDDMSAYTLETVYLVNPDIRVNDQ